MVRIVMRNGFILALNHAHLPVGTTQLGWNFGDGTIIKLSMLTGLALAVLFYAVMLAGERRKPPEPPPSAAHGAYSDEKWFHSRS
jgi:hypothetical protein